MPVLIRANEVARDWFELSFPFNRDAIAAIKEIPGRKWDMDRKVWRVPAHALPALEQHPAIKIVVNSRQTRLPPPPRIPDGPKLRDYQLEASDRMVQRGGFALCFEQRVGKTPTAANAAARLLDASMADGIVIMCPNAVAPEWVRQMPKFAGLKVARFTTKTTREEAVKVIHENEQYPVVCIHYEMLDGNMTLEEAESSYWNTVIQWSKHSRVICIADELHVMRNRKSSRAKGFLALSEYAHWRWALTGTPLRNYPRDMFLFWEFVQPGSMGTYSQFTQRYAEGHMGAWGWMDKGRTNEEELKTRLETVSVRKTRREVAPWLPAADRRIILCEMDKKQAKAYFNAETALGPTALKAVNETGNPLNGLAALKELAKLTTKAKLTTFVERVKYHALERHVKVLVFANFHETLNSAWDSLKEDKEFMEMKGGLYVAGGWLEDKKRKGVIQDWKDDKDGGVILCNTISSGTGIDLSNADIAIFLEVTWVPSDLLQAEARIEDVHQGSRTSPPLYEYLLAKGTIDEDMASKLLNKIAGIERISGATESSTAVSGMLAGSGVVDRNMLSLNTEDPAIVSDVLAGLAARLGLGEPPPASVEDEGDNYVEDEIEDDEEKDEDDDT